jgi:hypothetical protein
MAGDETAAAAADADGNGDDRGDVLFARVVRASAWSPPADTAASHRIVQRSSEGRPRPARKVRPGTHTNQRKPELWPKKQKKLTPLPSFCKTSYLRRTCLSISSSAIVAAGAAESTGAQEAQSRFEKSLSLGAVALLFLSFAFEEVARCVCEDKDETKKQVTRCGRATERNEPPERGERSPTKAGDARRNPPRKSRPTESVYSEQITCCSPARPAACGPALRPPPCAPRPAAGGLRPRPRPRE